jgi:ubiquinone/menaquinone biosynthesis C-methylase UbiE
MKLNRFEFLLMNNPLRALIQRRIEFPLLLKMADPGRLDRVLEIGCGAGTATRLIQQHLNPRRLTAIDLDERMIRIARQHDPHGHAAYRVMSISALGFADNAFDAVFDFGSLHHLPDWREALAELKRVLAPGGQLIMEDLSIESFSGFPGLAYRPLMIHPYRQMYTVDEFVHHAKVCGFSIDHLRRTNPLGLVKFFHLAARA